MHHISSVPSILKDIFQIFSKFLSKMMEAGILKTYTFLYSEEYCTEDNYSSALNAIEDLKNVLLKIFSGLASIKTICNSSYDLLTTESIDSCLPNNSGPNYPNHNTENYGNPGPNYNLYAGSSIHSTIDQDMQFMSNNSNMCNNLSQNLTHTNSLCSNISQNVASGNGGMCPNLNFESSELSNEQLKQSGQNLNFNECRSMTDHVNHAITYTNYKNSMTQNQNDLMCNVHGSSYEVKNGNDNNEINLDSNIGLNGIHADCNDSLYNTLKEAISGDFLQNIKFPNVANRDRQIDTNMGFTGQVSYSQCPPSLQQIDLDILSNSNERINSALDGIFEDQFVENDALLESECWNVDINLPSTEPMQSSMDLRNSEFDLSSCAEDMKDKSIENDLNSSLVSDYNNQPNENLQQVVNADLGNSLNAINTSITASMTTSARNRLSQEKLTNDYEGDKYFCEHCGFICNTKLKLKIHLKRFHNVYMNNLHKCEKCGKFFKSKQILMTHMNVHQEIKPFKCHFCWKTFSQKITLDSHVQIHNGVYKFPCSVCQKRFPTKAKLNFHSKSHEKPELSCEICSKMFTTKQYLNHHMKSHNKPARPAEKHFSCVKCRMLFERNIELSNHIREAHPDVTFMCYHIDCNRSFETYKKLKDHIYKRHNSSKLTDKINRGKFECGSCNITFVEKSSYHRHNLLVHCDKVDAENLFNCMHCDKRFMTEAGLDDHLEKFHSVSQSKDMDYSCSVCGSLFYEQKALKEHMNVHSDFGTHMCQTCGAVFSQKSDYLVHQSIHDLKKQNIFKKHKCDTCDTRFESKMELKQHELDDHNIVPDLEELKPYRCSYCEKRFTTRGKCNLHIETHNNSRKYQCNMCNKTFFRRDVLKQHMSIHSGYRAHICKTCGLGFTQKSSLKVHESSHDRKEKFTCETCNKVFQSKQALNYHVNTHEGNFRFACQMCGKKFVRKCHYDLHILCHSNERPFKCMKCSTTYKTKKHLRDHNKKVHQTEGNFNSLLDSIYTEDEVMTQPSILDEYIPSASINPLDSGLIFSKP